MILSEKQSLLTSNLRILICPLKDLILIICIYLATSYPHVAAVGCCPWKLVCLIAKAIQHFFLFVGLTVSLWQRLGLVKKWEDQDIWSCPKLASYKNVSLSSGPWLSSHHSGFKFDTPCILYTCAHFWKLYHSIEWLDQWPLLPKCEQ